MRSVALRLSLISLSAAVLAACAGPAKDISLIPTQTADITSKDGAFTQPLKVKRTKPGCKGDCPTLEVDSLIFPGNKVLTDYVDSQLADMSQFDGNYAAQSSINAFTDYFWQHAGPRDQVILSAKTRYRNQHLSVIELGAWQYLTGAAHGISETRFVNWDHRTNQPLGFNQIIKPNQTQAYVQRLQQAHQNWLKTQESAQADPAEYNRLWPFQPSDNIALTDSGLVVKYNSYDLAPYSSGQPELHIPYPDLEGIVQPQFLPR